MVSDKGPPRDTVAGVLDGSRPPGVHRWAADASAIDGARSAARRAGWHVAVLPAGDAVDKRSFLALCADAFDLPDWFGHNWDALHDCLTDLSWWGTPRGYLLIARGWSVLERTAPDVATTAGLIVEESVVHWRSRSTPMSVLLEG
ncbi:barstar family protein [Streptomyces marincola]|uniref:Barstar (barnase inhibitor) domain-containing protein n=1 Tax=Streptomyces marincola TaxID=2878388 RepID=A0A1W7D3B6_9ACTN|nr:barstar family protein [Streptomyces marincola]ARQ71447.1 hypothetical protein CAG99_23785 [Streptomyces marincola]